MSFEVQTLSCAVDVLILNYFWFCKIACAKVGDARKWIEAFDHAKQQV